MENYIYEIGVFEWMILLIFPIYMIIKIIINITRNELKRKDYSKVIKPGDQVTVPVMDRYSGEVLEVNGDEVKILVTAPKNRVYPK